jgi:hypothetical protein
MNTFKDSDGREWEIALDLGVAKRLRARGFDLLDEERLAEMSQDIITQADLLFLVCDRQAEDRNVSDEDFGRLLTTCFSDAVDALFRELAFFFRQVGRQAQATIAEKIANASREVQRRAATRLSADKVDRMIAATLDKAEAEIDAQLAKFGGSGSTKSPESSASTPPD